MIARNQLALITVLVASTAGCAVLETQKRGEVFSAKLKAFASELQPCFNNVHSNPKYASLYQKLTLNPLIPPTSEQLNDTERVSASLIPLGLDWYAEYQVCDLPAFEKLSQIAPELVVKAAEFSGEGTSIMRDAVTASPTYGEINRRIVALRGRQLQSYRQVFGEIQARLKRQDEADAQAQRQRKVDFETAMRGTGQILANVVLAAIAGYAVQQSYMATAQRNYATQYAYVPSPPIRRTSCSYINYSPSAGGSLSCSHY